MHLETWFAPAGDEIPNHPSFAVLIYRQVEAALEGPGALRELFAGQGWLGSWVGDVFDFTHYHSTSHEVLGVVAGEATLEIGGPQGRTLEVATGDVLVLPAGTGHRRARTAGGFQVVGAYPAGSEDYDMLLGGDPQGARRARERVAGLGSPDRDPVGGEGVEQWLRASGRVPEQVATR